MTQGQGHWEISLRSMKSHKEPQQELLTSKMASGVPYNPTLVCAARHHTNNTLKQFVGVNEEKKKDAKRKTNEKWLQRSLNET